MSPVRADRAQASRASPVGVALGGQFASYSPAVAAAAAASRPDYLQIYEMWCAWLDIDEANFPLMQAAQMLMQGGEIGRSFIQFLVRGAEPQRGGVTSAALWTEDLALRRSCLAMQVACYAFAGPCAGSLEAKRLLGLVCLELLGGLQPRSRACSLHLCTVLQHLLGAHDREVFPVLLSCHAPFVLLRTIDQPGCSELLQALLLGCEALLPMLVPGCPVKPTSSALLAHVPQYLRATSWPALVATLLDLSATAVAAAAAAAVEPPLSPPSSAAVSPSPSAAPASSAPAPAAAERPPASPQWRPAGPVQGLATPDGRRASQLLSAQGIPLTPPSAQPRLQLLGGAQAEPVLPAESAEVPLESVPPSSAGRMVASPVTPACGGGGGEGEAGGRRGLGCLVEFLIFVLESCDHTSEVNRRLQRAPTLQRPPQLPGTNPNQLLDDESLNRRQMRWQLFQVLFVETALVPHLFRLLRLGAADFEAAKLLKALLQHEEGALAARQLLPQFLPQLPLLGELLLSHAPPPQGRGAEGDGAAVVAAAARGPGRELLLSGYRVQEPLGAFRVALVQVLFSLAAAAPEAVLPGLHPEVWALLVQWFLEYRCNHIFQAACSRLWVTLLRHGDVRLQRVVLVRHALLPGLCDAVLAESACGDRWENVRADSWAPEAFSEAEGGSVGPRAEKAQVSTCKRRHPGGLGSILTVLKFLASRVSDSGTSHLQEQQVPLVQPLPPQPSARPALGERFLQPVAVAQAGIKPEQVLEKCAAEPTKLASPAPPRPPLGEHLADIVAEVNVWPQVLGAIGRSGYGVECPGVPR